MRWLLLDSVESVTKGSRSVCRSRVPDEPYSPEVLMVEMMAQCGAILLGAETDYKKDLVFAKIESAEFPAALQRGESLRIEAVAESFRPEGAWMEGRIETQSGKSARSRFLLMHVDGLRKLPDEKPITFHDAFMNHFQIRSKVK